MTTESERAPTGLAPGGIAKQTKVEKNVKGDLIDLTNFERSSGRDRQGYQLTPEKDWRVRITLSPESKFAFRAMFTNRGLMANLSGDPAADGVVFPYTPTITVAHNARYSEQTLTHSNYKGYFYDGSDVAPITISGVFTCQNGDEALYLLSSIVFLRACTKMRFGLDDPNAGTPPPLVRVSGYGAHYLPHVTCVVTQVSHTMPEEVDYVRYNTLGDSGWMPSQSTLTVTLQPIVSRSRQARSISLDDFVAGRALGDAKSPYGGLL